MNFSFRFLVCLCCENGTYKCRAAMVPIHASLGLATFMLACAACLTGITQKAIWKLGYEHLTKETVMSWSFQPKPNLFPLSTAYSEWTKEGIILNALGATIVAIAIVISFAVRRSNAPATAKVYVTERL